MKTGDRIKITLTEIDGKEAVAVEFSRGSDLEEVLENIHFAEIMVQQEISDRLARKANATKKPALKRIK